MALFNGLLDLVTKIYPTLTTITNSLAIDLSIRFNHYYHNSIIIDLLFGFSVSNLCYHLLQIHCPLKENNAKNISILL